MKNINSKLRPLHETRTTVGIMHSIHESLWGVGGLNKCLRTALKPPSRMFRPTLHIYYEFICELRHDILDSTSIVTVSCAEIWEAFSNICEKYNLDYDEVHGEIIEM